MVGDFETDVFDRARHTLSTDVRGRGFGKDGDFRERDDVVVGLRREEVCADGGVGAGAEVGEEVGEEVEVGVFCWVCGG